MGETGRKLRTSLEEHDRLITAEDLNEWAVVLHYATTNHEFKKADARLLHLCKKKFVDEQMQRSRDNRSSFSGHQPDE